jgi:hypothetical protein
MSVTGIVVSAMLLTGCGTAGAGGATPGATPSAVATSPAAGGNTAQLCTTSGAAARDIVVKLFSRLAEAASDDEADPQLEKIYEESFTKLSKQMRDAAAAATDPAFSAVLTEIAGEADKLATATDLANVDSQGLEAGLEKLERYCPTDRPRPSTAAAAGAVIGAGGSACELPVTFTVADAWRPKAVDVADDNPLAELARMGSLRLACEIDAKPAGHIGFLRVWVDPKGSADLRAALKPFLAQAKTRKVAYTSAKIGGLAGTDVRFEQYEKLTEEWLPHRAFAVKAPGGTVAVDLSGIDAAGHKSMLPAYELAKSTLAAKS